MATRTAVIQDELLGSFRSRHTTPVGATCLPSSLLYLATADEAGGALAKGGSVKIRPSHARAPREAK